MNTIGIISAMKVEIDAIHKVATEVETIKIADRNYNKGKVGKKEIIFVDAGVGKVNAAITTQILIDNFNVDCVINTGIAGGLDNSLNHMSIVIGDELCYHDMDHNILRGFYPFISIFMSDENLVSKAKEAMAGEDIHVGRIVTGDQFISETQTQERLRQEYDALCVEMEGASIAHTCYSNKTPFVVIRSISDFANDNSETDYKEFEKLAAERAANLVIKMVEKM